MKLFRWNGYLVEATEEAYLTIGRKGLFECWQEFEDVLALHGVTAPEENCLYMVMRETPHVFIFEKKERFTLTLCAISHG